MLDSLKHLLDVHFLVQTFGLPGVTAVIFAETGLMLGFFLPGDSLLLTAGVFAAKGDLSIVTLCILTFFAATIGNIVGYFFGQRVGKRLFKREDSLFFHKRNIEAAQMFYKKYGGKAIILARFMPIIRTFAPIVAGVGDMELTQFVIYSVIGSLLWAVGVALVGYYLGSLIPDKYFEPVILLVIIVSLIPAFYHALKSKETRESLLGLLRRSK